jgi:hypothetical protein
MKRLAFSTAAVVLVALAAGAEETVKFKGLEVAVAGTERVKAFRDLKVKDAKKHDLLIVRLEVRWTEETRHILIKEGDLAVKDARGKSHDCALGFVQASAPPNGSSTTTIEIPFHLNADTTAVSLRLGKSSLSLASPPEREAEGGGASAGGTAPQPSPEGNGKP